MKKYQTDLTVDTTKNIPYFENVLLSDIPEETVPFYYTTRGTERLDNISNTFYRTPKNWWIIAKANNIANGTISVPEGTVLFIPNINL
jgi:hypothetical protein